MTTHSGENAAQENAHKVALRAAFERWAEGTRYTHEHFWADPSKFVGHTPAGEHRAAEVAVLQGVPLLLAALERVDSFGCMRSASNRRCFDPGSGLRRDAEFAADAWCDACVARDALEGGIHHG